MDNRIPERKLETAVDSSLTATRRTVTVWCLTGLLTHPSTVARWLISSLQFLQYLQRGRPNHRRPETT